jgi:hypothetical protein
MGTLSLNPQYLKTLFQPNGRLHHYSKATRENSPMKQSIATDKMHHCLHNLLFGNPKTGDKSLEYGQVFECADWQYLYTNKITQLDAMWQPAQGDRLLHLDYLQAIEEAPAQNIESRYLLILKDGQVCGGFVLQLVELDTAQQIRELRDLQDGTVLQRLRKRAAGIGKFKLLVLGNMLLTGEHGEWWRLPEKESAKARLAALKFLETVAKKEKAQVIMVKDLYERDPALEAQGFHPLDFQPSMHFTLNPQWKTFEDYLEAMTSKYRVRARKAQKSSTGLVFRELDLRQIELFQKDLYQLYRQVIDAADFNMITASEDYFYQMKRQLGADYSLCACFDRDRLLGFYTTIRNGKEIEANFIGFDVEANRQHQLYLNMLYCMVKQGIQVCCQEVGFARTAMEIKSSVGATSRRAYIYLRHVNFWINRLLPLAVRFVEPKTAWVPRNPFREEA